MEAGSGAQQGEGVSKGGGATVSQKGISVPGPSLNHRESGILLHLTSLPSPYGIGDFGPSALSWINRLSQAGQSWWQVLPLGPVGYDNSPYQSLSSFAANVLMISPDWLIEDDLLARSDLVHDSLSRTR